jgi:hypothetical protein
MNRKAVGPFKGNTSNFLYCNEIGRKLATLAPRGPFWGFKDNFLYQKELAHSWPLCPPFRGEKEGKR